MAKRKIIKIDEARCNGCGLCIPNCPEGALKVIDGKARLISDLFCDGLGACIGHCPQGAITIEEREAEKYDEKKVMANIVKQGANVIKEHLKHLREHGETAYLKEAMEYLRENNVSVPTLETGPAHTHGAKGCPGSRMIDMSAKKTASGKARPQAKSESELRQWPVQITLVPPNAPYFKGADLLITADCVPFAYADFHTDLLKGKILLVGCPKLDDTGLYKEKITAIIKGNDIKSVTYAHMEVPCCFGLLPVIKTAITESGKNIPFTEVNIGIGGERIR
jgi:ferredoxin